jgi:hypothetical protein
MSGPQSDEKANSDEVQGKRASGMEKYLGIVAGALLLVFLNSRNPIGEKTTAKEKQRADERLIGAATSRMATYTGWLVAATAASVMTAIVTVCILANQWHEMQKAYGPLKDSADAAKKSADAAKQAVDVTVNAERPYLFVSAVTLDSTTKPPASLPKIDYGFINIGHSPTIIRSISVDCEVIGSQLPAEPQYKAEKAKLTFTPISAGAVFDTKTPIALPPCIPEKPLTFQDWNGIALHRENLLIFGYVVYDGIFGGQYIRGFAAIYWLTDPIGFHDVELDSYNYERKYTKYQPN